MTRRTWIACVLAMGCVPAHDPLPPSPVDAAAVCGHLCEVQCVIACDPACAESVSMAIEDRVMHIDVECAMGAVDVSSAEICEGVRCDE